MTFKKRFIFFKKNTYFLFYKLTVWVLLLQIHCYKHTKQQKKRAPKGTLLYIPVTMVCKSK